MPKASVFEKLTIEELRDLYRTYRAPEIRQVILELVETRQALTRSGEDQTHLRVTLLKVEDLRRVIDRAWKEQVGSNLVGLEELRVLLQEARVRMGYLFDPAR